MSRTALAGYLSIFLAAATPWLEVLLVIPAGILAGLDPLAVALTAFTGNAIPLVAIILAGDAIRRWRDRRTAARLVPHRPAAQDRVTHPAGPGGEPAGTGRAGDAGSSRKRARQARARRLAERWGLPGVALLGPLLIGTHLATVIALGLERSRGRVAAWMLGGLALWSVGLAVLAATGITFVDPASLPDLAAP